MSSEVWTPLRVIGHFQSNVLKTCYATRNETTELIRGILIESPEEHCENVFCMPWRTSMNRYKMPRFIRIILLFFTGLSGAKASDVPVFRLKSAEEYFSDQGVLSLLAAAKKGDVDKAKKIVSDGVNPNTDGSKDRPNRINLLQFAIASKDETALDTLLTAGADPQMVAKGFGSAFSFAVLLNETKALKQLLKHLPLAKMSSRTIDTVLFGAASKRRYECLEILLAAGASVDLRDSVGVSLLMDSIAGDDAETALWLLGKGASLDFATETGMTAQNLLQDTIEQYSEGSEMSKKLLKVKSEMISRGAKFPVLSREEVRAKHQGQKNQ